MIICETKAVERYMSNRFKSLYARYSMFFFARREMCVSHSHPPVDFVLLLTYLQALKLLNSHDDDDFKLRIIAIFRLIGYDDESSHQVSENWIYILQPLSRGSIARARR